MTNFLQFCDKHNLSFDIHYRPNCSDPNALFYLTFGTYHNLYILGHDEVLRSFHFSNGRTPQEAIDNAINELDGCCLQFRVFSGECQVTRMAIFKK